MKASIFKDEDQLITKAIDILLEELGPVEAGRFLSLRNKKRIESVTRHRKWQTTLNREEFFNRVFSQD